MPRIPARFRVARFVAAQRERTSQDPFLKPSTQYRREIATKALLKTWPGLGESDVRRITAADCQRWSRSALQVGTGFVAPKAKTVRMGMSPSSFNKCIDALRAIFDLACEQGAIAENPARKLRKAPSRRKHLELPSVTQFQQLVERVASAGARQSRDCADMVRLLAYSGARLREATALRWRDIDRERGRLAIAGTKSESSHRFIPLFPPLDALLREMRQRQGAGSLDARILRVRECRGALRTACRGLGIKRLTHHDLRHLFATCCIEAGVDIPTVSRWLGHADGGTLAMKTYGHLRQEHSHAQAAKVLFEAPEAYGEGGSRARRRRATSSEGRSRRSASSSARASRSRPGWRKRAVARLKWASA
jgi:integrase